MKQRVIKALRELSEKDHSKIIGGSKTLFDILIAELKLAPHELSARAERVLHAILHNYSDFAISTIDGFTHKVIRTFAHDLHLPLNFEIEMDSDNLLNEAIDVLVSRIGSDEKLTRALVDFTESKADNEKNWNIEYDLHAFAKNLLKEDGEIHLKKLRELSPDDFFSIRNEIAESIKMFETPVKEIATEAFAFINSKNLSAEVFSQGSKGIHNFFKKIAEGDIDHIKPNTFVRKTISENKWTSAKAGPTDKSKIEELIPKLKEAFERLQVLRERDHQHYLLCREINKKIYSLAVLNEIEKIIAENKKENNILHISEFNRIIANIVMDQPVPFIYERLGEKYHNFLLDEFQDTSLLQWQNLLPLIDNSLAENNFNMLVGDGKQSIYRWRGGDVELFAKLPEVVGADSNELLKDRERSLKDNYELKTLNKNFRSKTEIVEFNNVFFKFVADNFLAAEHKVIYNDLAQTPDPENTGGLVSLEFLEASLKEKDDEIINKTLKLISELKQDGFLWKDIAVITRNNNEGARIAKHLIEKGIAVVSSESLLLQHSPEVNFIINILLFLNEPTDMVAKAAILNYLTQTKKIKDKSVHQSLFELQNVSPLGGFTDILKQHGFNVNASVFAKMPLFELCEEVIRIFSLGNTAAAYVQFFLDEVLTFGLRNPNNISEFLIHWEERKEKASVVVPDAMDAVNILTIHRAKGLEFPVVIMPYANWNMDRGSNDLWIEVNDGSTPKLRSALVPNSKALLETVYSSSYEKENTKALLDNINLLYVAMTRASERTYMISSFPNQWQNLSKLFIDFFTEQGNWDPNNLVYEFGIKTPHKQKKSNLPDTIVLKKFSPNNWRAKVQIRQSAKDSWEKEGEVSKRSYGILLHNAIARIKDHTQVEEALSSMMNEELIDQEDKKDLNSSITKLFSDSEIRCFFEKNLNIKNESEILSASGEQFRPDRVIAKDKKAIVIDYKTGIEKTEHKKQLNAYAKLLTEIGYKEVEKYIIYTSEGKLERI